MLVYTLLRCKIHLVEGLKANVLIENDIMLSENFVIDIKKKTMLIGSCRVTVLISTRQRGQLFIKKLLISKLIMVSSQSKALISLIPVFVPDNCDFLFYPAAQPNLMLFTHIINHQTLKILVRNASNQPLHILHRHKLDHLIDIAYDNCFFTDKQAAIDSATFFLLSQPLLDFSAGPPLFLTNSLLETVLDNRVKIYRDTAAVKQITELIAEYPTIWESQGFVQISSE